MSNEEPQDLEPEEERGSAVYNLFAVWRLFWLDSRGFDYLDASSAGLRQSFVVPCFVYALLLAFFVMGPDGLLAQEATGKKVIVLVLSFLIRWIGFLLVVDQLTQFIDRRQYFARYVTAYNWSMVIQFALFVPYIFAGHMDLLSEGIATALFLFLSMVVAIYLWFIARAGLNIPMAAAIGIVVLDYMISGLVRTISEPMMAL